MKHLPLLLLLGGLLSASAARSADPVRYVDAATLTVIGKALPTTGNIFPKNHDGIAIARQRRIPIPFFLIKFIL